MRNQKLSNLMDIPGGNWIELLGKYRSAKETGKDTDSTEYARMFIDCIRCPHLHDEELMQEE